MKDKPVTPRKKGTLVSDIVWGIVTLLTTFYAFFCLHSWIYQDNTPAGRTAIFLFLVVIALSSQAPTKD